MQASKTVLRHGKRGELRPKWSWDSFSLSLLFVNEKLVVFDLEY
jgi:hypothetical protein